MTRDTRPVIMAAVEFSEVWVTESNPHGYAPYPLYRLDRPESVTAWQDVLQRAKALDVQGCLFWQPAGNVPGRPQYLVESHLVPPDVLPQLRAIRHAARQLGLWCGSLLRPAELSQRLEWDTETAFAFGELNSDIETLLHNRIAGHERHGADQGFYLDSFGLGDCDDETAAYLRSQVAGRPLFTEHASDRTLPYAGGFAEWTTNGWTHYGPQLEILQWLFPDAPWVALDQTWRPWQERIEWGKAVGVAPLVLAGEVPEADQVTSVNEHWTEVFSITRPLPYDIRRVVGEQFARKRAAVEERYGAN